LTWYVLLKPLRLLVSVYVPRSVDASSNPSTGARLGRAEVRGQAFLRVVRRVIIDGPVQRSQVFEARRPCPLYPTGRGAFPFPL
jgi:hypothetical protein